MTTFRKPRSTIILVRNLPIAQLAFDLLNGHNFPLFMKDVWAFKKRGGGVAKALAATGYAAIAGTACRIGDAVGVKRGAHHN